ncbi:MAG: riboflavin synthase [Deltaproteobacteria bacterium]|nr:MAG: riboflavin synthase [Pseudomonadota bacterium]PIE66324.1 MAG: riboflavin synthase [Deltaproteobacteria bacterium]
MFTGLIQDLGWVESVTVSGDGASIGLATRLAPKLRDGDSLAVNGVCLTVGPLAGEHVEAIAVPETLSRSTLGGLRRGDRVNLEPSLAAGDPMGGHIVQGHVDGVGTLVERTQRGLSWELTVAAEPQVLRYVVEKGSIAIDGVSLTVAALEAERFRVAIVPHTWDATALPKRAVGARVNLEVDILAKYVEKMLTARGVAAPGTLSVERLRELGY